MAGARGVMLQVSNAQSDLNRLRAKLMLAEAAASAKDRRDHAVQFYEDDAFLVNMIAQFAANGIALGEPVILIATRAHGDALLAELRARQFNVDNDIKNGHLRVIDAGETLESVMDRGQHGMPNEERFQSVLEDIVPRTPPRGRRGIRAYGEMVDVLWNQGNVPAALRLEELWNEAAESRQLSLLCGYAMARFPNAEHTKAIEEICRLHTHVLPTERFIERDAAGRRMEIVLLQQRARALETELARRKTLDSRLRRTARLARRARDVAQQANLAKSQFLAVMSHELRTPLNAIGGYAELLEMGIHGHVNDDQRDSLERIQRNQRHLLTLINHVLDYAKLETRSFRFEIADVAVVDALRAVEALTLPQIAAKGLRYAQSGARELMVRADPDKLHQIVLNLLTNATKFTNDGEIVVECLADDVTAYIHVRDTGIGIPAERLGAIFDPFVQLDNDYTRKAEGIGLGLAISRELARGMNGSLSVESTVGQGTTFTLALPRLAR